MAELSRRNVLKVLVGGLVLPMKLPTVPDRDVGVDRAVGESVCSVVKLYREHVLTWEASTEAVASWYSWSSLDMVQSVNGDVCLGCSPGKLQLAGIEWARVVGVDDPGLLDPVWGIKYTFHETPFENWGYRIWLQPGKYEQVCKFPVVAFCPVLNKLLAGCSQYKYSVDGKVVATLRGGRGKGFLLSLSGRLKSG